MSAIAADLPPSKQFHRAGYLLGFALGGDFDGILLHQILQWHHLLSGLEGEGFRDLRVQVLTDGIFHALMYLIAAIGLGCCGAPGASLVQRLSTGFSSAIC